MHPGALLQSSTAPAAAVTLGNSPASWTAPVAGTLYLAAGTVTVIAITRNGASTTTGLLAGTFRLRAGDTVTVTYSVIPTTKTFFPD